MVAAILALGIFAHRAFPLQPGDLKYSKVMVGVEEPGDKAADFHIEIANHHGLVAGDFIL